MRTKSTLDGKDDNADDDVAAPATVTEKGVSVYYEGEEYEVDYNWDGDLDLKPTHVSTDSFLSFEFGTHDPLAWRSSRHASATLLRAFSFSILGFLIGSALLGVLGALIGTIAGAVAGGFGVCFDQCMCTLFGAIAVTMGLHGEDMLYTAVHPRTTGVIPGATSIAAPWITSLCLWFSILGLVLLTSSFTSNNSFLRLMRRHALVACGLYCVGDLCITFYLPLPNETPAPLAHAIVGVLLALGIRANSRSSSSEFDAEDDRSRKVHHQQKEQNCQHQDHKQHVHSFYGTNYLHTSLHRQVCITGCSIGGAAIVLMSTWDMLAAMVGMMAGAGVGFMYAHGWRCDRCMCAVLGVFAVAVGTFVMARPQEVSLTGGAIVVNMCTMSSATAPTITTAASTSTGSNTTAAHVTMSGAANADLMAVQLEMNVLARVQGAVETLSHYVACTALCALVLGAGLLHGAWVNGPLTPSRSMTGKHRVPANDKPSWDSNSCSDGDYRNGTMSRRIVLACTALLAIGHILLLLVQSMALKAAYKLSHHGSADEATAVSHDVLWHRDLALISGILLLLAIVGLLDNACIREHNHTGREHEHEVSGTVAAARRRKQDLAFLLQRV